MAGYIRQSSFSDGDTITAALFNNEYNQILNAFSNTSGHAHDGTAAEGPVIGLIGDAGETAPNNKVLIDTTNNYIEFYVQVSSSPVQQLYIADGAIVPVTDSDIDIGTSSLYFKDAYIDSITTTGNVAVGGNLTVTGTTTFNGGTITMGDAATDNVVFGADVDSNIIPDDDDTYDLGSSSQQWRNLYIDGTAEIDTLAINGTTVTSTAAELNILDGVTSTAAELNILDGVTSTAAELNILDGVTASAADINLIDGITNGTVIASKAIITDANKDITGGRNITISGELDAATLDISGDADIDGTLEADAITIGGITLAETISDTVGAMVSSNTETNITVTYDDSDNTLDFVIGTLNQDTTGTADNITVSANNSTDETVYPIFVDGATGSQGAESDTGLTYNPSSGLLTTTLLAGTLNTAAQTNITSLGTLTALTVDNVVIDGAVIGHTSDTDLITLSSGVVTVAGELDATSLDISGDADIDGTLEADAITIGGVTLAETISDTVGAMVTSNTETGITVAYQDADNTLDFTIGTLNQDTTGTADNITVSANNSTDETVYPIFVDGATGSQGAESDTGLTYNPSSGVLTATQFTGNLTGNVTGNTSGTAATVTGAAQSNITSLGTLTTLTVDDITINGSTISDAGDLTVDVGGDINLDADGGDINFKDGGTQFVRFQQDGGNVNIRQDTQDKDILFLGDDGGVGIAALTLDMSDAGTAIFNHDITLPDNGKAIFGAGSDLQIYHNANTSFITESGSGNLKIGGENLYLQNTAHNENYLEAIANGAVTLYYNNSTKLTTTSTGATTTGLHTSTQSANITQVAITSSSNAVAWDARAAANAYHVTTENTTFSAPSNAVEGAIISVEIAQGSTARTIAWNTVFEFAASTAPTVTATANKTDIFSFRYNGSVWQEIGRVQNMAQT